MVYKVCIVCDKTIEELDRVDYDVFVSFFKYDKDGSIIGQTDNLTPTYFHKKCFERYKKYEKNHDLHFTQTVGSKRIIIKGLK